MTLEQIQKEAALKYPITGTCLLLKARMENLRKLYIKRKLQELKEA